MKQMQGRAICFLLSILLLFVLCPTGVAKTIYVDDDAAGANNGMSWTDAYTYLQEALNDARLAEKPVEVRVAQGTYRPNGGLVAIPEFDWRTTTFQLLNGVTLKGGYAGLGAPDPSARDIELYETILSGDLNGDDGTNFANNSENSYHVVTGSGTDVTAVLDGFTITAGNASLPTSDEDPNVDDSRFCGGGMYNVSGQPTLMNCIFCANSADWNGGGMYNEDSKSILTNCFFVSNVATYGGAMATTRSTLSVLNCTLAQNSAQYGNALACDSSMHLTRELNFVRLTNCILRDKGNEIWNDDESTILITFSDVQGKWEGEGNIDSDPLFADPDNGDYHLKSQAGRWNPVSESWVVDDVTSPCIDAGDPKTPVAFEPFPNGGIVNMGAYGGTVEASKSPSGLHAKYGGGTGEPNNPYLIYTPEQMNTIGLHAEDLDSHFKLMADVDLGGLGPREFNRIGAFPFFYFGGVFDGNGHTISNFTYISTDVDAVALFSQVEGAQAEIRDLGLIDPVIQVGMLKPDVNNGIGNRASSLVNYLSAGTVSRCYVQGGSVSGDLQVGGLIAYNQKGTIVDCSSTAVVTGLREVGGLVGYNWGAIARCHTISTITGENDVGGLVGFNDGTIQDSSAMVSVTGVSFVGGLVGRSFRFGTIAGSFSTGRVTGVDYIGSLVGRSDGDITNCYSTAGVAGGRYVGGLVGFLGSVTLDSCYSAGNIVYDPIEGFSGDPRIGGLVGTGYPPDDVYSLPSEILRSFWDIETSGQTVSFGGTGLTTTEMQKADAFLDAGWDFINEIDNGTNDIWWIAEGQDYPRLWWETDVN